MKISLALAALLVSQSVFASGGFICQTKDKSIVVEGGMSSAGTWVETVSMNGKSLKKTEEFTASQIYLGPRVFNFLVMDGEYNAHLLRVETAVFDDGVNGSSKGTVIVNEHQPKQVKKAITCEFLY